MNRESYPRLLPLAPQLPSPLPGRLMLGHGLSDVMAMTRRMGIGEAMSALLPIHVFQSMLPGHVFQSMLPGHVFQSMSSNPIHVFQSMPLPIHASSNPCLFYSTSSNPGCSAGLSASHDTHPLRYVCRVRMGNVHVACHVACRHFTRAWPTASISLYRSQLQEKPPT